MIRALLVAAVSASPAGAAQYLALGDSYTIGESVPRSERWPNVLAKELQRQGVPIASATIFARTGWTTDELMAALDASEGGASITLADGEVAPDAAPPYALVSLLIGVNNQYRGRDVASFEGEFARVLERAIAYAGGDAARVIVLSIPDWGVTPFAREKGRDAVAVGREIDAYNAAKRRISIERGAAFVDITPLTREAAVDPTLLADDGLHPSGVDYARWANRALEPARKALKP